MTSVLARLHRLVVRTLGRFDPGRGRLEVLRTLSTVVIVVGLSITLSALVFPRFPRRFFVLLLGDYSSALDALVVSEQLFSLLIGFSLLVGASIVHFVIDIYLGTLPAFWAFAGDAYVRLLVLASFCLAFATARILVVLSGIVGPETAGGSAGFIPVNEVWFQGYHIHHFFFGFLFLVVAGWLAIFDTVGRGKIAVLYGVGLGIFVDEFGLLLTEGDYFATSSYFVAVVFAGLVLTGIYWDRLSTQYSLDLSEDVEP